ncbi:GNAT family N-acetyltransferase [Parabacteroides sp. 52]|nr:thioredoxin type arsenate reductase [Parabacteroides sp. PM5-20]NDV56330.1 GNAT family N-acetyltransferase [Parabacteroides sp. 52]
MKIREVTLEDAKEICRIYNYYVENTAITFETAAVSESEMQQRIKGFLDEGFPYYVGDINGKIAGYCYLHNWNNRCAYSSTKEVTIYLDKDLQGKGIGTILYQHLFKEIHKDDVHALIAGICIPNESSVRLHEKFGFKQASHMKEIGWKFDQWRDVGHWQLVIKQIPPKILILCTGNSCRSQMAHGFLQSFDPKLLVYSAGTQASGKVNPKAIEVMQDVGVDISHYTSDSVEKYIGEQWGYVITVCGGANENCPTFSGKVKNRLHIGFDDPSEATGTPEFIQSEYIRVRDEIKKAFYELYTSKIKSYE